MAKSNQGNNFFTEKFTPKPKPVRITNKQFNKLPQLADLKREDEERRNNQPLTGWNTAMKKPSKFSQDAQYEKPVGRKTRTEDKKFSSDRSTDKRGFGGKTDERKDGRKPAGKFGESKERNFGNKKSYNAKDRSRSRFDNSDSRERKPYAERTSDRNVERNNERSSDRNDERNNERSSYRNSERPARFDRNTDRNSERPVSRFGNSSDRKFENKSGDRNDNRSERPARFDRNESRDAGSSRPFNKDFSSDRKPNFDRTEKRSFGNREDSRGIDRGSERPSRTDHKFGDRNYDRSSDRNEDRNDDRDARGGKENFKYRSNNNSQDRTNERTSDRPRTYNKDFSNDRKPAFERNEKRNFDSREDSSGSQRPARSENKFVDRNERTERGTERSTRFDRNDSRDDARSSQRDTYREDRNKYPAKPTAERRTSTRDERDERPTRPRREESISYDEPSMPLNKFVAKCGISSRRESVEIIKDGRVTVNGKLVTEPAHKVIETDKVKLDGTLLQYQGSLVYLLLNKPKDFITTVSDEKGRKTVMQLVASACEERIYPVGRLDRNTSGLLLLTNDGELTQKMSHPKYAITKLYQVNLDRDLSKADFDAIVSGLELEDGVAAVDELSYIDLKDKSIIGVKIHSGKNRIVRRIFESLEYEVKQLDRVMYANLTKKNLPRGNWRFLTESEVRFLKYFNSKGKS